MICPRWLVHTAAAGALAATAASFGLFTPPPDDQDPTYLEQPPPTDTTVILVTVEENPWGFTIVGVAVFPGSQREGPHCPVIRDGVLGEPMMHW